MNSGTLFHGYDGLGRTAYRIGVVLPYDTSRAGGVAGSAIEMATLFRQRGHTVDLIVGGEGPVIDTDVRRIPALIVTLPLNGSSSRIAVSNGDEAQEAIERLLRASDYDALVLHEPALPLSQAVLRQSTSANVGIVHAYSELRPPQWLARPLSDMLAPALERLHLLVAVSRSAASFAKSYQRAADAIVPNGLDMESYAVARETPRASVPTVLFLGRPEPRKGLDVLLHAVGPLASRVRDVHVNVAGAGNESDWAPYRNQVEELGIGKRVSFLGPVSEQEKQRLLGQAWALAAPAQGGESQGKILFEGFAAGVPVVASRIDGYAGVVRDSVDGLLLPPRDHEAWADALQRVLTDSELSHHLTTEGLRKVRTRYDWKVVLPQLQAVLEVAVAKATMQRTLVPA